MYTYPRKLQCFRIKTTDIPEFLKGKSTMSHPWWGAHPSDDGKGTILSKSPPPTADDLMIFIDPESKDHSLMYGMPGYRTRFLTHQSNYDLTIEKLFYWITEKKIPFEAQVTHMLHQPDKDDRALRVLYASWEAS